VQFAIWIELKDLMKRREEFGKSLKILKTKSKDGIEQFVKYKKEVEKLYADAEAEVKKALK